MKIKTVERIVRPRRVPGVNWSSERIVLARRGTRELWWWKGRSLNRFEWQPPILLLVREADQVDQAQHSKFPLQIHEGGRLSKKLLLSHALKIDEFFACPGLTADLDPHKTVLIEETP